MRSKSFSLTYSANFLASYQEQVMASVFIQIQFLLLLTIFNFLSLCIYIYVFLNITNSGFHISLCKVSEN